MEDKTEPCPTPTSTLKKKEKIVPKVLSFPSYQIVQKEIHNLRVKSSFSKDERQHAII